MITGAVFIDLKKDLTWSTMNVCFLSENTTEVSQLIYHMLVDLSTKISLACRPTNQSDNVDVH